MRFYYMPVGWYHCLQGGSSILSSLQASLPWKHPPGMPRVCLANFLSISNKPTYQPTLTITAEQRGKSRGTRGSWPMWVFSSHPLLSRASAKAATFISERTALRMWLAGGTQPENVAVYFLINSQN